MPNSFESSLIALSAVLATVLLIVLFVHYRQHCNRVFKHIYLKLSDLKASEASPYDYASAQGVEVFDKGLGSLEKVTDKYATAQMEGVQKVERQDFLSGMTSGRPEPRMSVAELVDFQSDQATRPGVQELYKAEASLGTIEEAPKPKHGTINAEFMGADQMQGMTSDQIENEESPSTVQGHAGGIVPISFAMQTNSAKQDYGSAFSLLTGQYAPNPSREECKHLCLNGGDPAYVELCDCTGYIAPVKDLGPLEREDRKITMQ